MGRLFYGAPSTEIEFDDRSLAHLQIVITAKLRRRESFVFTWVTSAARGSGRGSIWLDPSSTLYFRYDGSRPPTLNREWIEQLMASANSPSGLVYSDEPTTESA